MISPHNIPVFAICLEREPERKKRLSEHLKQLAVPFTFSNAIDGRKLSDEERSTYYCEKKAIVARGRKLASGELGCYLSHTTLWQHMVDNNIEKAFIIESDTILTHETTAVISNINNNTVKWDLIMLFYRECYPSIWQQKRLTENSRLVRFSNKSACTSGYLLTLTGAKKLLKKAFPIVMPVDDYMTGGYINKEIETFAVYPRCVHLTDDALETSTIREDLFPMLKKEGIKRRKPNEIKKHKEIEKKIRRGIKAILPPPWI